MTKLTDGEVETRLADLDGWSEMNGSIQRTYNFDDFVASMSFVNKISELAERIGHHPDILIRFGKVTLTLTTHDATGVTEQDFQFAADADALS
ncbi:MAG: 4a-hydroxytetrahydrobiopterin dehydratase [Phycisphaerales bacterium]|nr:4a-hydroxytetrahydrobiopterin dehydratase [Phycisphaerales bacterium]